MQIQPNPTGSGSKSATKNVNSFSSSKLVGKFGFTLIELLIAIVIIGILAAVLISVINPLAMRQRAQDGTIVANANKIVSVINAYHSATGVYPSCEDLLESGELSNVAAADCTTRNTFSITGVTFPQMCGTETGHTTAYAVSAPLCGFYYESDGATACLGTRLHRGSDIDGDGDVDEFLIWTSGEGRIFDDVDSAECTT